MSIASQPEGLKPHMLHLKCGFSGTYLADWLSRKQQHNNQHRGWDWGWGLTQDGSDYCNKAWKMRGEEEMEKQKERWYGEIGPLFTNMVYFLSSLINIWPVLFSRLDNRQTPFIEATRKQTEQTLKPHTGVLMMLCCVTTHKLLGLCWNICML